MKSEQISEPEYQPFVFYLFVVDYSHYQRIDDYIEKGTLYFSGTDRLLKLYVKDDEIAAHSFSEEKRELKKMSFDKLKAKGIHHLRIELR